MVWRAAALAVATALGCHGCRAAAAAPEGPKARVEASDRLFADLSPEDIRPRDVSQCWESTIEECLHEYQSGQFEGSQQHRSMQTIMARKAEKDDHPHPRLLVLLTSVWRNFERRRLQRAALIQCRRLCGRMGTISYFYLLGTAPRHLIAHAAEEIARHEDILLTGTPDEIDYDHIGDAYVLKEPHVELLKLVVGLRRLGDSFKFDYLLVADDDSFVSIPNALEVCSMLAPERVFVGNMIDTVPVQVSAERGRQVGQQLGVSMYLGTCGKVPVFAHGMGFIVSPDVARVIADVGLSLKMRGNDDLILGVWLRSIEGLHYLHYWPLFVDHEDYGGPFSKQCSDAQVIIHHVDSERWRKFDPSTCLLCGDAVQSEPWWARALDNTLERRPPPAENRAPFSAAGRRDQGPLSLEAANTCVEPRELACEWAPPSNKDPSAAFNLVGCVRECQLESLLTDGNGTTACPPSLCFLRCDPNVSLTLCGPEASRWEQSSHPMTLAARPPLVLAICIFGSRWGDVALRERLRHSLLACNQRRLGMTTVRHIFLMKTLPASTDPWRGRVAREILAQQDIAVLHPGARGSDGVTYEYEAAWRVIEDLFGTARYVLMLDHRSFVNLPYLVNALLPRVSRSGVYVGCLLDPTTFGNCKGTGDGRCDYLWRRRAPIFAHGMGILVSGDVARFVADLAARTPLRRADVPADVAFANWAMLLEGLQPTSYHDYFHEHPIDPGSENAAGFTVTGGPDISNVLSAESVVVWPMTLARWRRFFPDTCTLGPVPARQPQPPLPQAPPHASTTAAPDPHEAGALPPQTAAPEETAAPQELDCWKGMGGRPEAWYLVCCELRWKGCWGGDFTAEACCTGPPPGAALGHGGSGAAPDAAGALRRFLNFDEREVELLVQGLEEASAAASASDRAEGSPKRFRCLTPKDCVREAFARLYQGAWAAELLPLRHPWRTDVQDQLFGVGMKLRDENAGWGPKGHEHTLERVQLAEWLTLTAGHIQPEDVPGERRCLEWDSAQYSRYFFREHCRFRDVIAYDGGVAKVDHGEAGNRRYVVDIHASDAIIPSNSVGIAVCAQVFEHLLRPWEAMAQLFRVIAPGGFVVWSAPLFSEVHGAPEDYFRFTPMGARALAEGAGFTVVGQYSPGSLRELAGYLVGITAPYWRRDVLLADSGSSWPLQVYMLLRKEPLAS